MDFVISDHARERMIKYDVDEETLEKCLKNPNAIFEGYDERKVYNFILNGYVLRVIVEERKRIKTVVTVYKSRRKRYGI